MQAFPGIRCLIAGGIDRTSASDKLIQSSWCSWYPPSVPWRDWIRFATERSMTGGQIAILVLLAVLGVLLVWGRWRYDVVAFSALIAAILLGLVPASEAFAGFGHPATVTVALVLVLSRALADSGATEFLARSVMPSVSSMRSAQGPGTPARISPPSLRRRRRYRLRQRPGRGR